jgi:hypothetical protein
MGKVRREWSVEEFNNWCDASDEEREIAEAAGEEGGPRLSLLGDPDTAAIGGGTDWLGDRPAEPKAAAVPFQPEPSRNRLSGWSAHRQQLFIEALAETGTVHLAARRAGLSARSAYQLRLRSPAFAQAWNAAQQLAVGRLSALAFDRAIHGRLEQIYKDGELVAERRVPSERLLMWLLARLDPKRFAMPWEKRGDEPADPQADAAAALPGLLSALADTPEFTAHVDALCRAVPEEDAAADPPAGTDEAPVAPDSAPPAPPLTSAKIGKIGAPAAGSRLALVRSVGAEGAAVMSETKGHGSPNAAASKEGKKNPRESSKAQSMLGKKGAAAKKS